MSSFTSPWVVTLDYNADSTSPTNQAYAEAAPGYCSGADFAVRTFVRNADTGVRSDVTQPFFILIP